MREFIMRHCKFILDLPCLVFAHDRLEAMCGHPCPLVLRGLDYFGYVPFWIRSFFIAVWVFAFIWLGEIAMKHLKFT